MNHQGVIGRGNTLPWRLKSDMRFFKEQTTGNVVLMGRKTFDSLGRKPLRNRYNVVLSHYFNLFEETDTCKLGLGIADGLYRASLAPRPYKQAFVIGGESMYEQFAPYVDRYLITLVEKEVPDGDTFFCPAFEAEQWEKRTLFSQSADEENEASFVVYELNARNLTQARDQRERAIASAKAASQNPSRSRRASIRRAEPGTAPENLAMF